MAASRPAVARLSALLLLTAVSCARRVPPQVAATPQPAPTVADLDYFVIRLDGKQGFMDRSGRVVIPPRFVKVYPFTEGLAAAQEGELWGYIDPKGEWVIKPAFAMAGLFHERRASVRRTFADKYAFIDERGNVVIPAQFDCVEDFENGVARVGVETTVSK